MNELFKDLAEVINGISALRNTASTSDEPVVLDPEAVQLAILKLHEALVQSDISSCAEFDILEKSLRGYDLKDEVKLLSKQVTQFEFEFALETLKKLEQPFK